MPSAKRVLLVDDDVMLRQSLAEQLASEGAYTIIEAGTVAEAREKAREGLYEFMILDVSLPDGDGRQFCRQLRDGMHCGDAFMGERADSLIEGLLEGFLEALACCKASTPAFRHATR